MKAEGQYVDYKSLKIVTGRSADWDELAKDCVCFANARGGTIIIGIEDDTAEPPAEQVIPKDLPEKIRKRMGELTVNVTVAPTLKTTATGAEYIELRVSRSHSPASTTKGLYYLRVSDVCKPLVGDDIHRLLNDSKTTGEIEKTL